MSTARIQEIGQAMNVYIVPPLPDFLLPPVPSISDRALFQVCTTHSSKYQLPKRTSDLDFDTAPLIQDYEKLEHVGDGLLGAVATVVLHELYPNLREGPATAVKDHLVCNATLAQLADRYGLPDLLIASPSALYATKAQVKTKGSLFESWVAGVYYSFLLNGGEGDSWPKREVRAQPQEEVSVQEKQEQSTPERDTGIADSLTGDEDGMTPSLAKTEEEPTESEALPTPTASKNDILQKTLDSVSLLAENPKPAATPPKSTKSPVPTFAEPIETTSQAKTHGEAFQHILNWLLPLLTSVAKFALESMQAEQKRLFSLGSDSTGAEVMTWQAEDRVSTGAKAALHTYSTNKWGKEVRYSDTRAGEGLWRVTCEAEDDQDKIWSGEGIRHTKKSAGALAAYKVCCQLKLLK